MIQFDLRTHVSELAHIGAITQENSHFGREDPRYGEWFWDTYWAATVCHSDFLSRFSTSKLNYVTEAVRIYVEKKFVESQNGIHLTMYRKCYAPSNLQCTDIHNTSTILLPTYQNM